MRGEARWIASIMSINMVGVRGLEPPASASQTLRATRLRYTPQPKYNNWLVEGQHISDSQDMSQIGLAPASTS